MVDTFSPGLRLRKPEVAANEDVWAPLLNDDMITLLETGIAGVTSLDVSAGATLTQNDGAPDQSRAMFIRATGAPGSLQLLTLPAITKLYVIINEMDFAVAVSELGFPGIIVNSGQVTTLHCEAGDRTREVEQFGASVDDPGLVNNTFTFDIPAANGGAGTTAAVEYCPHNGCPSFGQYDIAITCLPPSSTPCASHKNFRDDANAKSLTFEAENFHVFWPAGFEDSFLVASSWVTM